MSQSILSQIEDTFRTLPIAEQLRLIERLVHQVNQESLKQREDLDQQLAQMAGDPQIQSELKDIEREFGCAVADGLGNL